MAVLDMAAVAYYMAGNKLLQQTQTLYYYYYTTDFDSFWTRPVYFLQNGINGQCGGLTAKAAKAGF
jgi:hypothetical protein